MLAAAAMASKRGAALALSSFTTVPLRHASPLLHRICTPPNLFTRRFSKKPADLTAGIGKKSMVRSSEEVKATATFKPLAFRDVAAATMKWPASAKPPTSMAAAAAAVASRDVAVVEAKKSAAPSSDVAVVGVKNSFVAATFLTNTAAAASKAVASSDVAIVGVKNSPVAATATTKTAAAATSKAVASRDVAVVEAKKSAVPSSDVAVVGVNNSSVAATFLTNTAAATSKAVASSDVAVVGVKNSPVAATATTKTAAAATSKAVASSDVAVVGMKNSPVAATSTTKTAAAATSKAPTLATVCAVGEINTKAKTNLSAAPRSNGRRSYKTSAYAKKTPISRAPGQPSLQTLLILRRFRQNERFILCCNKTLLSRMLYAYHFYMAEHSGKKTKVLLLWFLALHASGAGMFYFGVDYASRKFSEAAKTTFNEIADAEFTKEKADMYADRAYSRFRSLLGLRSWLEWMLFKKTSSPAADEEAKEKVGSLQRRIGSPPPADK